MKINVIHCVCASLKMHAVNVPFRDAAIKQCTSCSPRRLPVNAAQANEMMRACQINYGPVRQMKLQSMEMVIGMNGQLKVATK